MKVSRWLIAGLCAVLFITGTALTGVGQANAQEKRVALVSTLKGTVTVLKSGGAKPFKAFKNMSLNEGDQISTGKDSTVVLALASKDAAQDTVTVGENSQITFSKLKDGAGTKTKLSIWAGSLWVKVKSVSNANDQFEVETPTAIMGVRGTMFYVTVDPYTQISRLATLAGTVASTTERKTQAPLALSDHLSVYPTQQLISFPEGSDINTLMSIIDIGDFVSHASPEMIKAIMESAEQIQVEQEAMMKKLKEGLGDKLAPGFVDSSSDLQRVSSNMEQLLSLIAKKAIEDHKFSPGQLEAIIHKVNTDAGQELIQLDKGKELVLTEEQRLQREKLERERIAQELKAKAEAERRQRERDASEQLIKKLAEEKKKLEEANRKALEEQAKRAEEEYKKALDKKALDKFNEESQKRDEEQGGPSNPGGPGSGTTPVNPEPGQSSSPAVSLAWSGLTNNEIVASSNAVANLDIRLNGFKDTKQVYGLQIIVAYDHELASFHEERFGQTDYNAIRRTSPFKVAIEGEVQQGAESVDRVDTLPIAGVQSQLAYSVTKFTGGAVAIADQTTLVRLPFRIEQPSTATKTINFKIVSVEAVDASGQLIEGVDLTNGASQPLVLTVKRP